MYCTKSVEFTQNITRINNDDWKHYLLRNPAEWARTFILEHINLRNEPLLMFDLLTNPAEWARDLILQQPPFEPTKQPFVMYLTQNPAEWAYDMIKPHLTYTTGVAVIS